MNQPNPAVPDAESRSFVTDEPRTDLISSKPAGHRKLWAGVATAAVMAVVGVGALNAPTWFPERTTAAATVSDVPAADAAAGTGTNDTGPGADPAGPAVDVPAADVPAADVPAADVPTPVEAAPVEPVAAEPAPVEAAPAPAGDPNLYTVRPGDTVGAIAAGHGVDMNAMLAANGLAAYSLIVPGQTLLLTGPALPVPEAPVVIQAPGAPPAAQFTAAVSAPAPAAAPAPAPAPTPAVRTIYVAGAGGQSMVDACIGPIHFTPNDGYSLFITEHDFCGGWGRFSGIGVGETVSIPGYGTYTVTGRGQVPNPGTTNDVVNVFGGFPRAILQTCIPGTNQMLLIALN